MTSTGLRDLGRDLDRLFREGSFSGASDARLLERFVTDGDDPAFEALVARHRDMLLRTCHDLLGDAAAAEEAFQATLVILVRRAGSIREKDAIGGWLHRVACRVARRTRAEAARRRARERRAVAMRAQESSPSPGSRSARSRRAPDRSARRDRPPARPLPAAGDPLSSRGDVSRARGGPARLDRGLGARPAGQGESTPARPLDATGNRPDGRPRRARGARTGCRGGPAVRRRLANEGGVPGPLGTDRAGRRDARDRRAG